MNDIFSTREMARLCGVNESTIKRWADSGRLRCLKTPGGHRKFRIQDALTFLSLYGFDGLGLDDQSTLPETESPNAARVLRGDWDELAASYLELGLAGRSPAVVQFLFQLVTAGFTLVEICDRVITPALHIVGQRWQDGSISVLDEHLISAATIHGLERLRQTMPHRESNGLLALCSPVEGEQHEIGARMSALLLDQLGWDVRTVVDGAPFSEFVHFIRHEQPGLVCLSVCSQPISQELVGQMGLMWQASRETGTRLAFGGRGVDGQHHIQCDLSGGSLAELEAFAVGLAGSHGEHSAVT